MVTQQQKNQKVHYPFERNFLVTVGGEQRHVGLIVGDDRQGKADVVQLLARIFDVFNDALELLELGAA